MGYGGRPVKAMLPFDAVKAGTVGLEVFVVRQGNRFQWQLRKFGAVIIETAPEVFVEPDAARAAGEAALDTLVATPSGRPSTSARG